MKMKKWWGHLHRANREALLLSLVAVLTLISTLLIDDNTQSASTQAPLFNQAHSFRVQSDHGAYSLVFSEQYGFIGDQAFNPIARIKRSESINLRKNLFSTSIIRSLGHAQLDQEQQRAYGFDHSVSIHAPGQDTWTLASGADGRAYALDSDGALYELNNDLGALLNRPVQALRDASLGLPEQLERISNNASKPNWSLQYRHAHWWIQPKQGNFILIDQRVCNDWINIFTNTQAVTFLNKKPVNKTKGFIEFEGSNNGQRSVVQIFDHGSARNLQNMRIIERKEQIDGFMLSEYLVADIEAYLFSYPDSAFRSKRLIPFNPRLSTQVRIGTYTLNKTSDQWSLSKLHPLDPQVINIFFDRLTQLPNEQSVSQLHIGSITSGTLKYEIPHTKSSEKIIKHFPRYAFFDKRLFPNVGVDELTGLVIHSTDEAPQLYQRLPDGTWDLDPDTNKSITEFIDALSSARVERWSSAFDPKQSWTSTLTIAIGEKRVTLKKTDDHLIGIEALDIQGRLDQASLEDLFGE